MRYKVSTIATIVAVSAIPAAWSSQHDITQPVPYWKKRGCHHGHRTGGEKGSYATVKRVLRNHYPLVKHKTARLPHYAVCVATRSKSRAVWDFIRRSYAWRKLYEHRWPIKFHSFPAWAQNWAWSTGACESGNSAGIATGNGFYGAFQFMLSTWWAAGGTGMPHQHSWHYQAVIAIRLMYREGSGHWPNCG